MNAKKLTEKTKKKKILKTSKFHQNGRFDFLTTCHRIKIDKL